MSSNIVSNSGIDLPVVAIVITLFILVTLYYLTLYTLFKKPLNKLIVSYSIIIVLLIIILLISRYYFSFFKTYETFIADYKHKNNNHNHNHKNNNNNNHNHNHNLHLQYTNNPFASIYDIDDMCKSSCKENIGWKCRVRKTFEQDSFNLKNSASDANKDSSVNYKLKYDGIYDVKNDLN